MKYLSGGLHRTARYDILVHPKPKTHLKVVMQRISGDDRTCVAFTLVVIPVRLSIPACTLLVLRSLFTVIAERGETEPPNHSARHKTSMLAAPG